MAAHDDPFPQIRSSQPRAVDSSSADRTEPLRAVQPSRVRAERESEAKPADCRFSRAEHDDHDEEDAERDEPLRTRESLRSEESYRDLSALAPADRPLATHRLDHARALFETLQVFGVSNSRFADMIGINEKGVRKMLDGRSPIQTTLVGAMPLDMAHDFLARLSALRGGGRSGMKREIEKLRQARDLGGVLDAQRELLDIASWLSGSARR